MSFTIYTKTCDIQYYIPNVFTPHGDGKNDVFLPKFEGSASVEGKIFNRWGQIIYKWNGINAHWGVLRNLLKYQCQIEFTIM